MLSAEDARSLSPQKAVASRLAEIEKRIEQAAEAGKVSIRFPYELTEIRGEGSVTPKGVIGSMVVKELQSLGYVIKDHWDCHQFVDAYLTIEWGSE